MTESIINVDNQNVFNITHSLLVYQTVNTSSIKPALCSEFVRVDNERSRQLF